MSEITEQDAREASSTHEECSRKFFAGELFGIKAHDDFSRSGTTLIEFARQELSRRDDDRAERGKPITAEWCVNNGATLDGTAGACQFIAHGIEVEWDARNGVTVRDGERMGDWTFLSSITTRGQLLDLLAALKGEA